MKLNLLAFKSTELEETIDEEEKDDDDLDLPRITENLKSICRCEGKLYCMTDSGLRSGYYRIVSNELYCYKKREDQKYRSLIYLGHGACVLPFTPRI